MNKDEIALQDAFVPFREALGEEIQACAFAVATALSIAINGGAPKLSRSEAPAPWIPTVSTAYTVSSGGRRYTAEVAAYADDTLAPTLSFTGRFGRGGERDLIYFTSEISPKPRRLSDPAALDWLRDQLARVQARAHDLAALVAPILIRLKDNTHGPGPMMIHVPEGPDPKAPLRVSFGE